jgi:hypothetical protein
VTKRFAGNMVELGLLSFSFALVRTNAKKFQSKIVPEFQLKRETIAFFRTKANATLDRKKLRNFSDFLSTIPINFLAKIYTKQEDEHCSLDT